MDSYLLVPYIRWCFFSDDKGVLLLKNTDLAMVSQTIPSSSSLGGRFVIHHADGTVENTIAPVPYQLNLVGLVVCNFQEKIKSKQLIYFDESALLIVQQYY